MLLYLENQPYQACFYSYHQNNVSKSPGLWEDAFFEVGLGDFVDGADKRRGTQVD